MKKVQLKQVATVLAVIIPTLAFAAGREVVDIAVKGMTCPFCVYGLEKNLGKAEEIDHATASLKDQNVHIVLKPGIHANTVRYKQLIHDAGFTPGEAQVMKEEAK